MECVSASRAVLLTLKIPRNFPIFAVLITFSCIVFGDEDGGRYVPERRENNKRYKGDCLESCLQWEREGITGGSRKVGQSSKAEADSSQSEADKVR